MKLLGIVLALVCCGASAAKADWEYTKWGMTPQQVVSEYTASGVRIPSFPRGMPRRM